MKPRKWDAKTKATVVLEGLNGKAVATFARTIRSARLSIISGAISFSRMRRRRLR